MPIGHQQQRPPRSGQSQPGQRTSSSSGRPGQARLHQVPVAEQHRVGDRAEERGADQEAGHGQPGRRPAGVDRRRDEPDDADDRGDQVERRRELRRSTSTLAARRGRCRSSPPPARCALLGQRSLARHAGLAPTTDTTRATPVASTTPAEAASRTGTGSITGSRRTAADGHQPVDAAQQPAVAEADLAPPGGDPQEEQAADRPLQQERWRRRGGSSVGSGDRRRGAGWSIGVDRRRGRGRPG